MIPEIPYEFLMIPKHFRIESGVFDRHARITWWTLTVAKPLT